MNKSNYNLVHRVLLNVGLDHNFRERFSGREPNAMTALNENEEIDNMREALELFILDLPVTHFFRIHFAFGEHYGFQASIQPEFSHLDKYANYRAEAWNKCNMFLDVLGFDGGIEACPHIKKGLTHITADTIKLAIQREYRFLYNALLKAAKEIGLATLKLENSCVVDTFPIQLKQISLKEAQDLLNQTHLVTEVVH